MRNIIVILGFFLMIGLSAQSNKRVIEISGTISDKYPIKMILSIQKNEVLGYYYYEKFKTKILLAGFIHGSQMTLKESPDYESEFKVGFIGEFKDKMIVGNWIDKSKNLGFKVSIVHDTNLIVDDKIQKMEGDYKNLYSSDKFMSSSHWHAFSEA